MTSRKGPKLGHLKVLEFTQYIAGPGAGALLANLGADVVKIEPPGGEPCRRLGAFGAGMFNAYNAGKTSLELDLKSNTQLAFARELAAKADVIIENMRPGLLSKWHLSYEDVKPANPGVIYASISGYPHQSKSRDRPGLDIAAQAESGLMSVTGYPEEAPSRVGTAIVDAASAHTTFGAIMSALYDYERTGEGTSIETSLLDVGVHFQANTFMEYIVSGEEPSRSRYGQRNAAPAADILPTADSWVVISAYTESAWAKLAAYINAPDLITDPRFATGEARVKNRSAMLEVLGKFTKTKATRQLLEGLNDVGVVVGHIRTYSDVLASEEMAASGLIEVDGEKSSIGSPYTFSSMRPRPTGALPVLGAGRSRVENEWLSQ